ncbi:MAG: hypothetical protein A3H72_01630 [Candidatus Doudnabacteria bacterium RIFCSPLOWO2_02_FULL_48_8]|uniref:Type II secretion system protein GspG C-terminal domain-containing protein n=1 Tax=Candidatus Doudnabacteria bacterium RIFCSPHIGHO2_01_FULL_46_24 TaxID=1817825 RepID=A0A1F5NUK1_9BACT|nr:MAG: hypothetical protein A2720_03900 [Candidatus Doudnabacteria bacterium RIFCSPHIGHO2_01_FULL_46_24]OGE94986.1 MAG: hypothetical protein A3H72_01630 [Candidatus Doudnabacteria bacterium RIFCSPLOWO2_02_FULL_48_8]OGE95886.1 MAG: hypothetical protein A3E98_03910 [Candidatus Doudnabacteria bacterium RIFCSPHIGHO2_12_FULL_48_11]
MKTKGFTLIELLIVITIIGVLATVVLMSINSSRENGYYSRASLETTEIAKSLLLYLQDNGSYPPDANRDLPPGLEDYLPAGEWPNGPWPGSVYDWDNWNDPDNPGQKIYQISIRFCPIGGPLSACNFPKAGWAADFGVNSALYYCLSGFCRAHSGEEADYPGKCINC